MADFYKKNNQIRLLVGSEAGGGYDAYARLLVAPSRQVHPGNPTIVVQNMPGAGGIVAANYLYNAAPKDGTVIGSDAAPGAFRADHGRARAAIRNRQIQLAGQPGERGDGLRLVAAARR